MSFDYTNSTLQLGPSIIVSPQFHFPDFSPSWLLLCQQCTQHTAEKENRDCEFNSLVTTQQARSTLQHLKSLCRVDTWGREEGRARVRWCENWKCAAGTLPTGRRERSQHRIVLRWIKAVEEKKNKVIRQRGEREARNVFFCCYETEVRWRDWKVQVGHLKRVESWEPFWDRDSFHFEMEILSHGRLKPDRAARKSNRNTLLKLELFFPSHRNRNELGYLHESNN